MKTNELQARPATAEDRPEISLLLASEKLPIEGIADADFLVIRDAADGVIAAAVGLEQFGQHGLVRSLVVPASHRGRGLSLAALTAIERHARDRGIVQLYLITTSAGDYFRRLGWVPVERAEVPVVLRASPQWRSDVCPVDAAVFRRHLSVASDREMSAVVRAEFDALARGRGRGEPTLPYRPSALIAVSDRSVRWSSGCGTPLAYAAVKPGETVLDLGSGSGLDVLLAADQVGAEGKAIGLDFSPAMVERAASAIGERTQVHFALGDMVSPPFADGLADLVITNSAIHFVRDKASVLREAYRILRPGGRMVLCEVVADAEMPVAVAEDPSRVAAGIGFAIKGQDFLALLRELGFRRPSVLRNVAHRDAGGYPLRGVTIRVERP